ncbi:nucleoporin Nup186/Nup192/Nup205 [Gilbertella persicaria]|uniref:nucleoporin Nup186/Nup192/Nup205 n=1 Tax=Gilbertella persicaria TaxID=101096 RepID=UPI00221E5AE8|nr:nucleoporin Nup186/Nup192/Nup205 [Gilbertella persicaria]KAI8064293.1 nucleoporin Nup186/Nup192/Nup205 [Gilbertella persicaria]
MSSTYSIPTWIQENQALHDAICQARASKTSAEALNQLLQVNKEKFLNLLDDIPKDSTHRSTLNNNKAYINRTSRTVSKEFTTKALFLSDQLNINEYVAATLLMRGTTESGRLNSNAIDAAVLLYHEERGYILACLDAILKSAKDASVDDETRFVCSQFISELLKETIHGHTYINKLISTLENITQSIHAIRDTGTVAGQIPAAGSGKLGEDISELRMERLSDERILIVQIIYHTASLFDFDTKDKLKMLELLEDAELTDQATSYMIIAMISVLSHNTIEEEPSSETLDFIDQFHSRIMTHGSKVPVVKAVVVLQWILYLSSPIRASKVIGSQFNLRSEKEIQDLLDKVIIQDVFRFMSTYLLYFQQPNANIDTDRQTIKPSTDGNTSKAVDKTDYRNINADIRSDFQPFAVYELQQLGLSFINILFERLQKLKYKEEDTNTPLTDSILSSSSESQCHDLQYFLEFMASVFRNRVNQGAVFWNRTQDGLHHFVRWLLDIKVVNTVCAAFDFFGSITTGDACASNMFHFFKLGTESNLASSTLFSWGKPLASLEFYADLLKNTSEESHAVIPVEEEKLLLKFLDILKQCVQYSQEARRSFWTDGSLRCQEILVKILNCPTSTNLRAALFDVLAAFCSHWGGGVSGEGREISLQVWKILEGSDMLMSRSKTIQDRSVYQPAGILQELEFEKKSRVFTETLSVVRLIASAIHTQSLREAMISGFPYKPPSIPSELGKGTKTPGSIPYIALVVDNIFLSLREQKYAFAEARWELTEACLSVLENSAKSFDVSVFENEQTRMSLDNELKALVPNPVVESTLLQTLVHPGFQIMIRVLAGGRVIDEMFQIIDECAQKETKDTCGTPYHRQCLIRALRILDCILSKQNTFMNIIIPYISSFSKKKTSSEFQVAGYTFTGLPSLVSLGQLFLFKNNMLARIAMLVNFEDQEEVCYYAVRILDKLANGCNEAEPSKDQAPTHTAYSALYSNLSSSITSVLSSSESAERIVFGFSERLALNVAENVTCDDFEYDINNIPFWCAVDILSNAYDYPVEFKTRTSSSVRLVIMDLLLKNIQLKSFDSLAEFLLGYDPSKMSALDKIQDTEDNQPRLACFHAILNMLRQGIDSEDAMMEDTADPTKLIIDSHPILAEKCYELIYRLCAKKLTSTSTLRYLRNRENFFYNQFNAMLPRIEDNMAVESKTPFTGVLVSADGTETKTDFFRLRSKLHQRAWLLDSMVLEFKTTMHMGQKKEATKLLELLYGRKNIVSLYDDNDDDTSMSEPQESGLFSLQTVSYQQPLTKILELISSLDFVWVDSLLENVKQPLEAKYFTELNPRQFEIENERGCFVYDIRYFYKQLRHYQHTRYPENPEVERELSDILSHAVASNHQREIAHAKLHCLKAWKDLVHISIIECFDLLGDVNRETIIHEILSMLLPKFAQTKGYDGNMLKSMSEIVLNLVDKLRVSMSVKRTSHLPVERLRLIFQAIVDCIRQENTTILIRGDMYSALTSFLIYIIQHERDATSKQLEQHILDTILADNAHLINTLRSDAFHGLDIWKTTAYIALDALNRLALLAGSQAVQLQLVEHNFLQATISMIRTDDAALSNLLGQISAPLLPLYIFEAKMSLLLRIARDTKGAELLYDHRILEVLSECQYLKVQQDYTATEAMNEATAELNDRRQRLVMPTLSLIVTLLCTFQGRNDAVLLKTESWVRNQQPALVNILQYERHQVTLDSLKQINMIAHIMVSLSCRRGYTDRFQLKGFNQLHNTFIKLNISKELATRVAPMNEEQLQWNTTIAAGGQTLLKNKALQCIDKIHMKLEAYRRLKYTFP